jgi:deazaflavin-dependent oxidoreductase (nitroreductase family)
VNEPQYLYLTTIGRRSGQKRQIEIWFTERAGRYYIIAEHGTRAQWVLNIVTNPKVGFRVGERTFSGTARVLSAAQDGELVGAVQQLSRDKYGWDEGLVVELTPDLKQF